MAIQMLRCTVIIGWRLHDCRTLAMVKPDAFKHLGKILNAIYQSGFRVK